MKDDAEVLHLIYEKRLVDLESNEQDVVNTLNSELRGWMSAKLQSKQLFSMQSYNIGVMILLKKRIYKSIQILPNY